MRVTTGIDIVEVNRIEKSINDYKDRFLNRIYTDLELKYCEESKMQKYEKYAARFAAKEAVYKALDIIDNGNIKWTDIEVSNKETGRPLVTLSGDLKKYMDNIEKIDISLSHIKETAVASVVVMWRE